MPGKQIRLDNGIPGITKTAPKKSKTRQTRPTDGDGSSSGQNSAVSSKSTDSLSADSGSSKVEQPWFEKYRPKSIKDMVGFKNNIKKILDFIANFEKKMEKKQPLKTKEKALLLEGPPGIGKTTVVYAVANDLGYSVVEMNASDVRTEAAIKKKLDDTVSTTNLMGFLMKPNVRQSKTKKIILIDEVDGISGQSDRGGLSTLIKIIEKTRSPIIMTANFYNPRFKPLYDKVTVIKCRALRKPSIINILKKIAAAEHIKVDTYVLNKIAENSNGDLRSAINDLQGLAQGTSDIPDVEIDIHRDVEISIFNFIRDMFTAHNINEARNIVSSVDIDYDLLDKVIYENLTMYLGGGDKAWKDYARALDMLMYADVIMGRIRKDMDFSLLPYYYDMVSGGIVTSIENPDLSGFKRYKPPSYFGSRFAYADDILAIALQKVFKVSRRDAIVRIWSFITRLYGFLDDKNREKFLMGLSRILGLDPADLRRRFK